MPEISNKTEAKPKRKQKKKDRRKYIDITDMENCY